MDWKKYKSEFFMILIMFFFIAESYWVDHHRETIKFPVSFNFTLAGLSSLWFLKKWWKKKNLKEISLLFGFWALFSFLIPDWIRQTALKPALLSMDMQRWLVLLSCLCTFLYCIKDKWLGSASNVN